MKRIFIALFVCCFALGAFDSVEFDSFDFVRVEASHRVSQIQEGLARVV